LARWDKADRQGSEDGAVDGDNSKAEQARGVKEQQGNEGAKTIVTLPVTTVTKHHSNMMPLLTR